MNNYETGDTSRGSYRGGQTLLIDDAKQFHRNGLLVSPNFCLPKEWVIS